MTSVPLPKKRKVRLSREKSLELFGHADGGDLEACRRLLDAGADVNVTGKYDCTPLHYAAQRGHVSVCELLLQYGADLHAGGSGVTPLHDAAFNGHADVCRLLISHGADCNKSSGDRNTPLHGAAEKGDVATCRVLLEAGADRHAGDITGRTPLHRAAGRDHVDVCRLLTERDPHLSSTAGQASITPFQEAVRNGSMKSVTFFVVECGEDLAQITDTGKTLSLIAKGPEMRALLKSLKTEMSVRDAMHSEYPNSTQSQGRRDLSLL